MPDSPINKSTFFLSHRNASSSRIRYSQGNNIYRFAILASLSRVYLTNNSFRTFVCPLLLNICVLFVTNCRPVLTSEKKRRRIDSSWGGHARKRVISRGDDETTLSPLLSFSLFLSQPLTRVKSSSYARKFLGDASAEILISAIGSKILRAFCRLSTSGFGYNRFVDSTADDSSSSICGRPIRRVQRGCGKENLIVLSGSLVDKLSLCDRRNGYHSSFLLCP